MWDGMGWDWTGISDRPTTIAPLKAVLIKRKYLEKFTLKNGRKNLNNDFINTRRGGGHHFLKVFLKISSFF